MSPRVVVLDDDSRFRRLIEHHLTSAWSRLELVSATRLEELQDDGDLACHVCDHSTLTRLTRELGRTPFDWLAVETAERPEFSPVIIAEPSSELLAVKYMKAGAGDYLPKQGMKHDLIVSAVRERIAVRAARRSAEDRTLPDAVIDVIGSVTMSATALARGRRRSTARPPPTGPGYRIERSIGAGGIAEVYLAHSETLDRLAVLKVLRFDANRERADEAERRFELEHQLISSINSSDVVAIYDYGTMPSFCYFAMEYFPRGDLMSRLKEPVSEREALSLVRQIARALHKVHALGIVHRDLKPGNVMLREDGSIALIDFGMARLVDSTDRMTATGAVFGTPFYLSPEQADGRDADHRSDLYSLGVVFYELLTAEKPFSGATAVEVCVAHMSKDAPPLPAPLARFQPIMDRLLAKRPIDRFQSAAALLESLGERMEDGNGRQEALGGGDERERHRRWSDPADAAASAGGDDPSGHTKR